VTVTGPETRPNLRPVLRPVDHTPTPLSWSPADPPPLSGTERLLLLAERAVGRLAPTLHAALLMVVCAIAGVTTVAVFAGLLAAVLSTLVLIALAVLRR
jgi:hypothetical protein